MQRSGPGPKGPKGGAPAPSGFRSYPSQEHRDRYAAVVRAVNELAQAWGSRSGRIRAHVDELKRVVVNLDALLEREPLYALPAPKGGAT